MGVCSKSDREVPVVDLRPAVIVPRVKTAPDPIPPIVPKPVDPPSEPLTITVSASLQNVSQPQTDTVNTRLPEVFYVIVGRGPAAVINHTTLLQSTFGKKRLNQDPKLGKLPVMYIGFRNPWSWYFAHGMGQPNYLLGLPGFHPANQPGSPGRNEMKDEGLKSVVFGACVDDEMSWCLDEEVKRWAGVFPKLDHLEAAYWPVMNGCAMWIQKRGAAGGPGNATTIAKEKIGPGPIGVALTKALATDYPNFAEGVAPYRLAVLRTASDGALRVELVYAQYIDLCTGSGRPRQARPEAECNGARLEPWRDPGSWPGTPAGNRRIAVATEAIRQEFTWPEGQRICIANGGAIGLNAAERARDEKCWTDWFHNASLLGAADAPTFANPRNFSFLKSKRAERPRIPNEDKPIGEEDLIACDPRIRMGRFAQVKSMTATCDLVLEKGVPRAGPALSSVIRDYYPATREFGLDTSGRWEVSEGYARAYLEDRKEALPSVSYDYLIFHAGLDTAELGQPANILAEKMKPKTDATGAMISLESADGFIRVLGAAAQASVPPLISKTGDTAEDKMWKLRQTLPISAVPDGFILSGLNIAKANEYFADKPNKNINTMSLAEIETALDEAGLAYAIEDYAAMIFRARNLANGFSSLDDLIAKAAAHPVEIAKSTTKEKEIARIEKETMAALDRLPSPQHDDLRKLKIENAANECALWKMDEKRQISRLVTRAEIDGEHIRSGLEIRRPDLEKAFQYSY